MDGDAATTLDAAGGRALPMVIAAKVDRYGLRLRAQPQLRESLETQP
jgi:hypothetical protein